MGEQLSVRHEATQAALGESSGCWVRVGGVDYPISGLRELRSWHSAGSVKDDDEFRTTQSTRWRRVADVLALRAMRAGSGEERGVDEALERGREVVKLRIDPTSMASAALQHLFGWEREAISSPVIWGAQSVVELSRNFVTTHLIGVVSSEQLLSNVDRLFLDRAARLHAYAVITNGTRWIIFRRFADGSDQVVGRIDLEPLKRKSKMTPAKLFWKLGLERSVLFR